MSNKLGFVFKIFITIICLHQSMDQGKATIMVKEILKFEQKYHRNIEYSAN